MSKPNRLATAVAKVSGLPPALRRRLVSFMFNSQVKFAGTAGIEILELSEGRAVLRMKNRGKVQNHIKGVHAAGMALLAESATGVVLGITLPDTHLPLLKTMHVDYVKRATGTLTATATLPEDLRRRVLTEEKGDFTVPCTVTDEAGIEPIKCAMTWAWVPKRR